MLAGTAPQVLAYLEGATEGTTHQRSEGPTRNSSGLLASRAGKKLGKKELASITRYHLEGLVFSLLLMGFCIALAVGSVSLLYFELTTGALITIAGQVVYPGVPTHYLTLDPVFFAIAASFGVLLTAAFLWLAAKKVPKIRLARRLERRFQKPRESG